MAGVAPGQVLAVGDSQNDADMLDGKLGFQAATVANADPEIAKVVEAAGDYLARSPRSLGVAEIVRKVMGAGGLTHEVIPGERISQTP